jgi:hypothetical protein
MERWLRHSAQQIISIKNYLSLTEYAEVSEDVDRRFLFWREMPPEQKRSSFPIGISRLEKIYASPSPP